MNRILEIDLHGMDAIQAKKYIEKILNNRKPFIEEIVIVHGHNGGNKLANMVRKELKHKSIKRKILSLNKGITTLLIDKDIK